MTVTITCCLPHPIEIFIGLSNHEFNHTNHFAVAYFQVFLPSYFYANDLPCSSPAKPPVTVSETVDNQHSPPGLVSNEHSPVASSDVEAPEGDLDEDDESEKQNLEQPPLPDEQPPPLPNEEPPVPAEDDGWEPVWDESAQAFYFYNRFTHKSQWENPRVPEETQAEKLQVEDTGPPGASGRAQIRKPAAGGYDPAIHGDYDPNADYAKVYEPSHQDAHTDQTGLADPTAAYAASAAFNRFTGKWQSSELNPDKFSDENKSKRQMNAFFDVDAAANAHDGRSLKAERSNKKISKQELKAYREKRREKKEEKKRAWLRD